MNICAGYYYIGDNDDSYGDSFCNLNLHNNMNI